MANNASDYLELKVLKHIFKNNGGAEFTPPAANSGNNDSDGIFVSLHTGSPAMQTMVQTKFQHQAQHMLVQMLQML